ncbi:MAG: double-strand break repair helicase AddA [Deltaproteobacteria bacterium]
MTDRIATIEKELERTKRVQSGASNPASSAWVSANAGTGKTHVLKMRVLRLLLAGVAPQKILCLTYTKAAAAEMSKRVFNDLAKWVILADDELKNELSKLLSRPPTAAELARARTLFTSSIETPGGFKVQTIHAFAERLLQRFPLEAGVTPGFSILDEADAHDLRRQAINEMLAEACAAPKSELGGALECAVAHAADERFDQILTQALSQKDWIEDAIRQASETEGFAATEAMLRRHFGVRGEANSSSLLVDVNGTLTSRDCLRLAELFQRGTANDQKCATRLRQIANTVPLAARAQLLCDLFFNSKGEVRETFATKATARAYPEIESTLSRAQARFVPLWLEKTACDVIEATMALMRLADAVLQKYSEAKARRAGLDFEDLIARTRNLLASRGSAEWVLYKLDNGIDHLLVDESQDTSPEQWQIVMRLAEEFFAGSGGDGETRTIFAVGDEKQSIYSFQGAAPEMFAEVGNHFADRAAGVQAPFERVELDVSFRTTSPVLAAVDKVFSDPQRTPGVPAGRRGIHHVAKRLGQAGSVEIWQPEKWQAGDPSDPWSPLDERSSTAPSLRLAERIAKTIRDWLDNGERLESMGRPVRAGDILILVRKRRPFATPMVAALKAAGVRVAGADRLAITQHIAVQDLISLGGFLTLPEDDLALAEVLKSPIFDLDDDDLLRLANRRKSTLWKSLLDQAGLDPRYGAAAETLKRWRKSADFMPPYEFWASLLDRDGIRAKLISRLGPDAADPVDEFLNVALDYDDHAPASLTGFLHALTENDREIKRDTEQTRDEVRVMTVHGAKGLEAPIVFLPDTCATGVNASSGSKTLKIEALRRGADGPVPIVWPVSGSKMLPQVQEARARQQRAEEEERNRLLYVAMTRPRDRLIIAGFEGKTGRAARCWFNTVCDAFQVSPDGPAEEGILYRSAEAQGSGVPPDAVDEETSAGVSAQPLPAWAQLPAPREKALTIPLAPSRLAPYETDDDGEPRAEPRTPDPMMEPAASPPFAGRGDGAGSGGDRFLRGTLTHALLEHLPEIEESRRAEAASAFLDIRARDLSAATRRSIAAEALAIVSDPAFGPLFSAGSRAEVPIVAEIANPNGRGPPLRLTGQIDRLAVTDEAVLIVDYKTNRGAPRDLEGVAPVYLYQLAAYRLALAEIYGSKPIRAALLWTEAPHLMAVPEAILDSYVDGLWRLDGATLDAAGGRS